jgi:hypothetical protein
LGLEVGGTLIIRKALGVRGEGKKIRIKDKKGMVKERPKHNKWVQISLAKGLFGPPSRPARNVHLRLKRVLYPILS